MDNYTVVQLKAIAKERGIRCYYKLRKTEFENFKDNEVLGDYVQF